MNGHEKKETKPSLANERQKDELRPALTEFYGSVAPELVKQGAQILREFRISEEIMSKLTDPESFADAALKDPNLTSGDIEKLTGVLQEVQNNGTRVFKPIFRQLLKRMPRIPGGGRPHAVSSLDEKRAIIEEVHKLLRSVSPGIAKKRVAMKYGIGRRTVQRIWKERDQLPPKP